MSAATWLSLMRLASVGTGQQCRLPFRHTQLIESASVSISDGDVFRRLHDQKQESVAITVLEFPNQPN